VQKPQPVIALADLRFDRIVADARALAGLSQAALAQAAGVTRDKVARIEQGHGGGALRDVQAVLAALDRHGVVLLPCGRPDLANAPRWQPPR
jgi:transcriptional regulator with XRE-family HTH domain